MDGLIQDKLTKLAYGRILKNSRNNIIWSQDRLAQECYTCRRTIVAIETGETPPNQALREAFAKTLSNPLLEYFPQYSIGQFCQRLKVKFKYEKEAIEYFLEPLKAKDLISLKEVYFLYNLASKDKDNQLMIVLDEYLHTRIMNAHPDEYVRRLVERYRQDYMDFFKILIPQLKFNMAIGQNAIHVEIFQAILELNQEKLSNAIDLHLSYSLNDVEQIIRLLKKE
ncbi:helix-turn-helix transcriptional regulator [Nostoc sp.]|uniref:helix-turn-helix transcriptional regulator n=1 Tax=Nostoc sp. TaxID=1180 RepID=UPI002FF9E0DB